MLEIKPKIDIKFLSTTIVGAVLEFYDFMLYGIFAAIIGATFFPLETPMLQLSLSFSILALGYFTRPLGGILFGYLGDKYSRRLALTFALILMGTVTTFLGLLPGYHAWGISATLILVVLRLLQGLTVGGEMPGAMIYLLELAPLGHRAFLSSLSFVGAMLGIFLAIFVANLVSNHYSAAELKDYAWRLPFLFGVVLAVVGAYLRLKLWQDKILAPVNYPIYVLIRQHWFGIILALGFLSMAALYTGIVNVYLVPFATEYLHYSLASATKIEMLATLMTIIGISLGAAFVDYLQAYRRFLLWGIAVLAIVSYPLFFWIEQDPSKLALVLSSFAFIASFVMGAEVVFLGSLFPQSVRYTGVGFTHGAAFSIIVGLSPLILNYVVIHWGIAAPGALFASTAVVAWLAVFLTRNKMLS